MASFTESTRGRAFAGAGRAHRTVWASLFAGPLMLVLATCGLAPTPPPTPKPIPTLVPVALTPAPSVAGDPNAGRRLFPTKCATCHTLPGVTSGIIPQATNLNNIAVKPRIAGETLDNSPDNMKRWISSPQTVKPGTIMSTQVTDAEAQDLTAFLYSLPYNPGR